MNNDAMMAPGVKGGQYRRWALDLLRQRATARSIEVTGPKDRPCLFLARGFGLKILYQERWLRSGFQVSGYGGHLVISTDDEDPECQPAYVMLSNLPAIFTRIRAPQSLDEVDLYIDRLVNLAQWCIDRESEELLQLARAPGASLSKAYKAATIVCKYLEVVGTS